MTPSQKKTAIPVVGATGVEKSVNKDGSYGEYDVVISVNYAPHSGAVQTLATKTERMTAAQLQAFREAHHLSTAQDFVDEFFAEVIGVEGNQTPILPPKETPVPNYPYEANNTNDFEVPPAVQEAVDAGVDESKDVQSEATPEAKPAEDDKKSPKK